MDEDRSEKIRGFREQWKWFVPLGLTMAGVGFGLQVQHKIVEDYQFYDLEKAVGRLILGTAVGMAIGGGLIKLAERYEGKKRETIELVGCLAWVGSSYLLGLLTEKSVSEMAGGNFSKVATAAEIAGGVFFATGEVGIFVADRLIGKGPKD